MARKLRHPYYNRQGEPITAEQWIAEFRPDDDYRRVAIDVWGDVMISTVWLGLDHNFGWGEGPPLIFETMCFGGALDQEPIRYASEAEALVGHAETLALVKHEAELAGVAAVENEPPEGPGIGEALTLRKIERELAEPQEGPE